VGQYYFSWPDRYSAYIERLAFQDKKSDGANSGFMKVGPQSVDMRPERDNQQLTKQNPMSILIFYIYSRLSDLCRGDRSFPLTRDQLVLPLA
jgi:hypothetical protein